MITRSVEGFRLSPQQLELLSTRPEIKSKLGFQCLIAIEGGLDPVRLESAWRMVIEKHEILRTQLTDQNGDALPLQIVGFAESSLQWKMSDELMETVGNSDVLWPAMSNERNIWPITDDPIIKIRLTRLADKRYLLYMSAFVGCVDTAGFNNLLAEICRCYGEWADGNQSKVALHQYADLAEWYHELLEGSESEAGLQYWSPRLQKALALNVDARYRQMGKRFEPRFINRDLRISYTSIVAALSSHDAFASAFLFACWCILIAQLMNKQDIVVAVTHDGRNLDELKSAVGVLCRDIPHVIRVTPGSTLLQLVKQCENIYQEIETWQHYWISPQDTYWPVGYQFSEWAPPETVDGVKFEMQEQYFCIRQYDLKLNCIRRDDKLKALVCYDSSCIEKKEVDNWVNRYLVIVEKGLKDIEQFVRTVTTSDEKEEAELLLGWNATTDGGDRESVPEMFARSADAHATAVAVKDENRQMTYAELNWYVNQVARGLQAFGVGRETVIGLCVERSLEMVAGMLAILKAGAAFVPLDAHAPPERLKYMIEDSGARLVLSSRTLLPIIEKISSKEVLAIEQEQWQHYDREVFPANIELEQRAYVIYTSGSTGRPKGVVVEHRQLSNYVKAIGEKLQIEAGMRMGLVSTYAADLGYTMVFPAICLGGCLDIVDVSRVLDAFRLEEHFRQHPVDCLKIVPSHLRALMRSTERNDLLPRRWLILGGEASNWDLIRQVKERQAGCRVLNHYGPTETTVGILTYEASGDDKGGRQTSGAVPIGRPLRNGKVYLLDDDLNFLPVGMKGNIYVGGAGVSRGYVGNPGETAEKFVPDPFSLRAGERMYCTGDLGRWNENGAMEFLGRSDNQVKIRGYRVELEEIEKYLKECRGVQDAVVVVCDETGGEKELVGYVVANMERGEPLIQGRPRYWLPNGMGIAHQNANETRYQYEEIFQQHAYMRLGACLWKDACVVDVGANIGMFTLFASHHCPLGRVYAFEPIAEIFEKLRINAELYGTNVQVYPYGLSDREREEEFTYYQGYSILSGMKTYADQEQERALLRRYLPASGIERDHSLERGAEELLTEYLLEETRICRLRRLSAVMKEEGILRVDLLKIDVQRAEADVLLGIEEEDWKKIGQIVMEVHDEPKRGSKGKLKQIRLLLESRGFEVAVRQDEKLRGTDRYNVYAVNRGWKDIVAKAREAASSAVSTGQQLMAVTVEEIQQHLRKHLPEYMIPAVIVDLPELPLTANGKVDRKGLPLPEMGQRSRKQHRPPRIEIEKTIARVWEEILAVEQVGIDDNFFELGGDSILSIQVIARLRATGVYLTPRQMFERQTIAGLSEVAGREEKVNREQQNVSGVVELTPIQQAFFEWKLENPKHFNQGVLLELKPGVNKEWLERVVRSLVEQHDALRMRYEKKADQGQWEQWLENGPVEGIYERNDLSALVEKRQAEELEQDIDRVHRSMDLAKGGLMRVVEYDLGEKRGSRLLLVAHHLVIDAVSWRILLEDLEAGYGQLSRGEELKWGPKGSSYRDWAERLKKYSTAEEIKAEQEYWYGQNRTRIGRMPRDFEGLEGDNRNDTEQSLRTELGRDETRELLQKVPGVYHTQINDVLLTALARTCGEWMRAQDILIEVEGHGREELFQDIDVTRTVGWFTTIFPVVLEGAGKPEKGEEWNPGEALKNTKERLRGLPNRGLGHGVLRYLRGKDEEGRRLREMADPEISFNYLGQIDSVLRESTIFSLAQESSGRAQAKENRRRHIVEVTAAIIRGHLQVSWSYSEKLHRRETIERLAEEYTNSLREVIAYCRRPDAGGYTPSDFPLAFLEQEELDRMIGQGEGLEDIYGLSPMQQGMLFHSLYEPDAGVYFIQLSCRMTGKLNVEAFHKAWEEVVGRHAILRTGFLWEGLRDPVQVVKERVEIPWLQEDWRGADPKDQQDRWEKYLEEDRKEGVDLKQAPLLRLALITIDDGYYFAWSKHHLLLDGWCHLLVIEEVFACYGAYVEGRNPELQPVYSYRDYIGWLQKQDRRKAEAFWRENLKGFRTPTRLGTEPRNKLQLDEKFAEFRLQLTEQKTQDLEEMTKQLQITLNTLMQGAWGVLLSRYTREADVVFGATVSGRSAQLAGIERMIGLFINTLPVRITLNSEEIVGDYLKRLQKQQVAAREYEYTPLLNVQQWSEIPPGTSLLDHILVFENYPMDSSMPQRIDRWIKISEVRDLSTPHYPLTLRVHHGDVLSLAGHYDKRYFSEETIASLLRHLQTLLIQMASDPNQTTNQLSLLTRAESQHWLDQWKDTSGTPGKSVSEMFHEQVQLAPDQVAIEYGKHSLTYADSALQVDRTARALLRSAARKCDIVMIFVERRDVLITAIIGVVKAGCAFMPISPRLPDARVRAMIRECAPSYVIVDTALLPRVAELGVELNLQERMITSEYILSGDGGEILQFAPSRRDGDDLIYIYFTSGSTGTPKPVAGRSKGLDHFIQWEISTFGVGPGSRISQLTFPMFDPFLRDIFVPLCCGGTLCIPEDEDLVLDGEKLSNWIAKEKITLIHIVPTIFRRMLEQCHPDVRFGALRHVLSAGEPLLPADVKQWYQVVRNDNARLINVYGPTETTLAKCAYPVSREDQWRHSAVPVGRPIPGAQVIVMDRAGALCPPGVIGEVYLRTGHRSLGYFGRPELTAQVFIQNPFSKNPQDLIYRTGDLGYILQDGNLELIGRQDQQVKILGVRIELDEVESVLNTHEGIQRSVVIARENKRGEKYLVAYVVLHKEYSAGNHELRGYLWERLPSAMVPSSFVLVPELPLLANGKIDRARLRDNYHDDEEIDEYQAPQTVEEQILCDIFGQILKRDRVGAQEDFFKSGGHSLLATQVISRINQAFSIALPLKTLFEIPTISALAEHIRFSHIGVARPPSMEKSREGNDHPLSYAQQRLWMIQQLQPNSSAYNLPFAFRLNGFLDKKALQSSLDKIVELHEILRTSFLERPGIPVQQINNDVTVAIEEVNLEHLNPEQQENEASRLARIETECPFNLSCCPLVRVKLFRFAEQDQVLLVVMHHIISDGWSFAILVRELNRLYEACLAGINPLLPELKIQYKDYAVWQRKWLDGGVLEQQLLYWKEQLAGLTPLTFRPLSKPPQKICQERISFYLDVQLTSRLKERCRSEGITLFMGWLAALQITLRHHTGQEDVVVGTGIANRNHLETEGLIGFFVNSLILRSRLHGEQTIREFLKQVRNTSLNAYRHQDVPFEKIVEELSPARDSDQMPFCRAMMVMHNMEQDELRLSGLRISGFEFPYNQLRFDLLMAIREVHQELLVKIDYSTAYFDDATIGLLKDMLEAVIRTIIENPDQTLVDIQQNLDLLQEQNRVVRESRMHNMWMQKLNAVKKKTQRSAG